MSGKHVIVVGSGGAGMAAAASAALAAASVTVLESQAKIGGTTAISGGAVWLPATKWQAKQGVEDTPEEGIAHLDAGGRGDYDAELSHAYVTHGNGVLEAIEEHTPLRWHHMTGFPDYHSELPGGKAQGRGLEVAPIELSSEVKALIREDPYDIPPTRIGEAAAGQPTDEELADRVRRGMVARGPGLIGGLTAVALEHGAEIRTGVRVRDLIIDGDSVVGVKLDGEELEGSVILASGGFERSEALVKHFIRGPLMAPAGPPGNRGDGLLMAMSAGAALGNMSEAWWAPSMEWLGDEIDGEQFFRIMFTDCAHPGGVLIDAYGRRFVNEATNYSDLGRGFHEFDAGNMEFPAAPAWLVFDETRRLERGFVGDTVWTITPGEEQQPAGRAATDPLPSWMQSADTLAGLAEEIGVPGGRLQASVERFNADVPSGVDREFGRGSFIYDKFSQGGAGLRALTDAPFHAIRVLPGALGTKGGPKTDAKGRVLRQRDGEPVPGLYAAGNAAASPFGMAYPGPGATVGPAVVFGWLAARDAAGV